MSNHVARRTVQVTAMPTVTPTDTDRDNDGQSMIVLAHLVNKPNEPKAHFTKVTLTLTQ